MIIDSINEGIVIDHITAGKSMDIYRFLSLAELDCSVAIIKNAKSSKMGKKDIIKIENEMNLSFDILGYVDPEITVNIIEKGEIREKMNISVPKKIVNVVSCKNPRCITTTERGLDQIFFLADIEKRSYRCIYCEQEK